MDMEKVKLPTSAYWAIPGIIAPKVKKRKTSDTDNYNKIVSIVCDKYAVRESDIVGKSQLREFVVPRQVIMYFARYRTKLTLKEIAEKFNRDHATASHSTRVVENLAATDKNFKKDLIELDLKISECI